MARPQGGEERMKPKLYVVIHPRSVSMQTGLRKLVPEKLFETGGFELMIEVEISPAGYVPVDKEIFALFSTINPAFVGRVEIRY